VEIVRLREDQLGEASEVLARAFHEDPAWIWLIPDERRRAAILPWLFRVGFEIAAADVWTTEGPVLGCARWLPPGRPPMRVGAALRAFIATPLRMREATSRFFAYGRALENMRTEAAKGPHWYLAGLGVDPSHQRQGIGSALLAPGIEGAARERLPCVLLTNDEQNLSFYERHGFETVLEGDKPPGGPHAWAMVRKPL
jgi:ribosomal protein S18 acetylase RimI-like enzyme